MAKIAYIITSTEPTISHLKAIITPISKTSHGKALGKLLNPPLVSNPDIKEKISQNTAITSNKILITILIAVLFINLIILA